MPLSSIRSVCVLCKYGPSITRLPVRGQNTKLRSFATYKAPESGTKDNRPSYARISSSRPHTRRQNSKLSFPRNEHSRPSRLSKLAKEIPKIYDIPPDLQDALNRQLALFNLTDELRIVVSPKSLGKRQARPRIIEESRGQTQTWTDAALAEAAHELLSEQRLKPSSHIASDLPQSLDPTLLGHRTLRCAIHTQLTFCTSWSDLQRVLSTALSNPLSTLELAALPDALSSTLIYLRRQRQSDGIYDPATDVQLLMQLTALLTRFRAASLPIHPSLLHCGIYLAASTHQLPTLPALKRFLAQLRTRPAPLPPSLFSLVAGAVAARVQELARQPTSDGLTREDYLQVLLGFEGLKGTEQCHLGVWLAEKRSDWRYLGAWIKALGRAGEGDAVWAEWEMWAQEQGAGAQGKKTEGAEAEAEAEAPSSSNSLERRAAETFIFGALRARSPAIAWRVFAQSGVPFALLPRGLQNRLVQHPEFASSWTREMEEALLGLWEWRLGKIERRVGVRWVADGVGGGFHRTVEELESVWGVLAGRKERRVGQGQEVGEENEGEDGEGLNGESEREAEEEEL